MAHDFLISNIGGEKRRVDTLGEISALSWFQHVPFREIFLQLLQVLLVQELNALNVIFQRFQLTSDWFRLLLQGQNVILKPLLFGVLSLLSLNQVIHCIFAFYILQSLFFLLYLASDLIHHLTHLLSLRHFFPQQGHILFHSLVPPVWSSELFEGLCFIKHLFWSQIDWFYQHLFYLICVCFIEGLNIAGSCIGLLWNVVHAAFLYLWVLLLLLNICLFGENHRFFLDNAAQQVLLLVAALNWNHNAICFSTFLFNQTHQKGQLVVALLDQ